MGSTGSAIFERRSNRVTSPRPRLGRARPATSQDEKGIELDVFIARPEPSLLVVAFVLVVRSGPARTGPCGQPWGLTCQRVWAERDDRRATVTNWIPQNA